MNNNQLAGRVSPSINMGASFLFFRSFLPLAVLLFCAGLLSAQQQYRTWTSANGAKLQARMLGFDGAKVTIERSDKQKFVFPLNLLSPADQAYVRQVAGRLTRPNSPISPGAGSGASLPIWSPAVRDAWWQRYSTPQAWDEQAPLVLKELQTIWGSRQERSAREGRDFFTWFRHWRWLSIFSKSRLCQSSSSLQTAFVSIGKNETLRDAFLRALHPKDNQPKALELFLSIAVDHPSLIERYAALATAYAIVFDQPFPRNWPHHQVPGKDVPVDSTKVSSRFAEFVAAAKSRKLEYDPAQLAVSELKFVVDHLLPKSELDWARLNVKLRRSTFDKAFKSIQYDKPRLSAGVFSWPNGPYTLASISERGGICVDQAYFSSMSGKAKGIPTLTFVGQGSGGGHAWFGFLKGPGRWATDCGRYENQNYPVGNAIDPQLWKKITDDELGALARGEKNLTGFRGKSVDYFEWALANPDQPFFRESLQRARTLHPGFVDVWTLEAEWVEDHIKDPRELRNFWDAWVKAFGNTVDLKIEGQKKLADAYDVMGNPRQAEKIRALIVSQNRGKRFDLAIQAASEQLMKLVEAKDWAGAEKQYERFVRDFEKTAGGELFYKLVRPYVETLSGARQGGQARDAIDYLKKRDVLDLGPDSIIGREMKKLEAKLGG
jgi:hypothetical protein